MKHHEPQQPGVSSLQVAMLFSSHSRTNQATGPWVTFSCHAYAFAVPVGVQTLMAAVRNSPTAACCIACIHLTCCISAHVFLQKEHKRTQTSCFTGPRTRPHHPASALTKRTGMVHRPNQKEVSTVSTVLPKQKQKYKDVQSASICIHTTCRLMSWTVLESKGSLTTVSVSSD